MLNILCERCAAWVTRLRDRLRTDPFLIARLKITALFFLVGVVVSVVISDIADQYLRAQLYDVSLLETGPAVERAFETAQETLLFWRSIKLLLLVICAYLLATYALRPIRRATELQRHFIANVSHELRTPLTVMKTEIQVALRKKNTLTLPDAARLLEANLREVDSLTSIVQLMLAFADLENRRGALPMETISLSELAREAVRAKELRMPHAVGRLHVRAEESLSIHGSRIALQSMVSNLLRNALRHTPEPGTVTVSVVTSGNGVALSVSDTGEGIASEDLPHVFEPFYRAQKTAQAGLGLGLSIVREIARMHGARIGIASEERKGTTVTVVFPRA